MSRCVIAVALLLLLMIRGAYGNDDSAGAGASSAKEPPMAGDIQQQYATTVNNNNNNNNNSPAYSHEYVVNAGIGLRRRLPTAEWPRLESRLGVLFRSAFEQATLRRFRVDNIINNNNDDGASRQQQQFLSVDEGPPPLFNNNPFQVEILDTSSPSSACSVLPRPLLADCDSLTPTGFRQMAAIRIAFVVKLQGSPIPAQTVVDDISRAFTFAHASAMLHYPLVWITTSDAGPTRKAAGDSTAHEFSLLPPLLYSQDADASNNNNSNASAVHESRWWIIAIIIGSGMLMVLCGWMLLFIYYNTCGRPLNVVSTPTKTVKVEQLDLNPSALEQQSRARVEQQRAQQQQQQQVDNDRRNYRVYDGSQQNIIRSVSPADTAPCRGTSNDTVEKYAENAIKSFTSQERGYGCSGLTSRCGSSNKRVSENCGNSRRGGTVPAVCANDDCAVARRADKSVMTSEWPKTSGPHHQQQLGKSIGPVVQDEADERKAVSVDNHAQSGSNRDAIGVDGGWQAASGGLPADPHPSSHIVGEGVETANGDGPPSPPPPLQPKWSPYLVGDQVSAIFAIHNMPKIGNNGSGGGEHPAPMPPTENGRIELTMDGSGSGGPR